MDLEKKFSRYRSKFIYVTHRRINDVLEGQFAYILSSYWVFSSLLIRLKFGWAFDDLTKDKN